MLISHWGFHLQIFVSLQYAPTSEKEDFLLIDILQESTDNLEKKKDCKSCEPKRKIPSQYQK
jgi:hypothetical protein